MGFWRRRETLNEKLLREAGLERPPLDPQPAQEGPRLPGGGGGFFDQVGITGLHRLREWDASAAVEAPGLGGDELSFVVLPDGSLLVDEEVEEAPLAPRADVEGDELELVSRGGERSLTVDGARTFGSVPQLARLAESRSPDYVVHASRLDGSLWEVRVDRL
ncbi:MAG: hypothetical protein E6G42_06240 [Actinobacteria bacterium]|nr:MAG: hypothetical protein E6G42_06240 [Actinomycetota bacterium]